MEDEKKISPQMKYYLKNKEELNKKRKETFKEKYYEDIEFKNKRHEKSKEQYKNNKEELNKRRVHNQIEQYKNDEEFRQKRLDYAKKYREQKKIEKNEKNLIKNYIIINPN